MKNLIILFLVTTLVIFSLTSCQKEQTSNYEMEKELHPTTSSTIAIAEKPMNTADPKLGIETQGIPFQETFYTTGMKDKEALRKKAHARSTSVLLEDVLFCGSTIKGNNQNKGNDTDGAVFVNQGCLNTNYGFNGEDVNYMIWADVAGDYTIHFKPATADLDIFLFSVDTLGQLDKCLGYSIQSGTQAETIHAGLDYGAYVLVVDAPYIGDVSNFDLDVICAILADPIITLCEDFESSPTGPITPNNPNWIKYSATSGDAFVYTKFSSTNSYDLHFDEDSDVVNLLDAEYTSGVHDLVWSTFIPTGKTAAFAFEKYAQPGKEHTLRVYLATDGTIQIYAKNQYFHSSFTYRQNQWIDIEVKYSLNSGQCSLIIDGNHVANFSADLTHDSAKAGVKQLAGINFWGRNADSSFYLDNICQTHSNPTSEVSSTTMETLNIHPDF